MIKRIIALSLILFCDNMLTMDDQQSTQQKPVAYFYKRGTYVAGDDITFFYDKNKKQITFLIASQDCNTECYHKSLKEIAVKCGVDLAEDIHTVPSDFR